MTEIAEREVEAYFDRRVRAEGGEVRKVGWISRRGAPDKWAMFPDTSPNFWAEIKRPGGMAEPHQEREHARMRACGEIVHVLDSFDAVDAALAARRTGR